MLLLDEDEFNVLNLEHSDPEAWPQILTAEADLRAMVAARHAPFSRVQTRPA